MTTAKMGILPQPTLYYKLKYNLDIPKHILEWISELNLDSHKYGEHLVSLNQSLSHYCYWKTKYKHLPTVRFERATTKNVEVAKFLIDNISSENLPETDVEYFSVLLKIALDKILDENWEASRPSLE